MEKLFRFQGEVRGIQKAYTGEGFQITVANDVSQSISFVALREDARNFMVGDLLKVTITRGEED